jgi:hypothetical protein
MNRNLTLATVMLIIAAVQHPAIAQSWTKHIVTEQGHCNTAVALDATGDGLPDIVASMNGKVSLFVAPDWQTEIVLHRFRSGGGCIHSAVLDVDGDGDMDWAGALAHDHPFWLQNPGSQDATKGAWAAGIIDPVLTGIHCLRTADIDNDGRQDLIINNFEPAKGIPDSIAWYSAPKNVRSAGEWQRHVFANGDARGGSHYMGAGDINGDGWNDIAVGAKGKPFADGNWFAFWTNPGKPKVEAAWKKTVLAENQTGATNILPADVNGDGKTDWLATRGHGSGVLWFENPDWTLHEIDPDLKEPHSLTVADFDLDGDIDAASCGYGSEQIRLYVNDGAGHFDIRMIDRQQQSYHLSSIDMDNDGDLDLLNAGRATQNVVWYENPAR